MCTTPFTQLQTPNPTTRFVINERSLSIFPSSTQVTSMPAYAAPMYVRRPLRKAVKARPSKYIRSGRAPRSITNQLTVPRNIFGFPSTLTTYLRYNDTHTIQGSSGQPGGNVFRLNSCYDPDYTGVGHQPLYYDTLTPLYQNYVVIGATVKVDFSPLTDDTETTTTGPYTVGLTLNTQPSWAASGTTLTEQNKSITTMLGRDKGTSVKTLTLKYNTRRDLGVGIDDDTAQAGVDGNPGKTMYLYVWCADQNLTSGSVKINTTITYHVKFFTPKNVIGS